MTWNWKALYTFLLTKALERSTWLGLIALAGLLGYVIRPEHAEAIIMIGTGIAGLLMVATSDAPTVKVYPTITLTTTAKADHDYE
ncbi:hypothetical protein KIKIMORA_04410 [Brevundimonas phage vB_BpoS-Kikimora]|uniref:Uncharacterized protein n=1 Tax=Brevundimonas phage vB_BpoS-Kikimora TaxID=2948601 RepID=A0A9E7MT28_9CAUD|nr:hypothetical protein KIKIMORA_04410 [Brevundimonas phage vB_BpoS-Kikimora]